MYSAVYLLLPPDPCQGHPLVVASVHGQVELLGRRPVAGEVGVPGVLAHGGRDGAGGGLWREVQLGRSVYAVVRRTAGLGLLIVRPEGGNSAVYHIETCCPRTAGLGSGAWNKGRGKFGVHDIFVKPDLRLKPSSVVMI